MAKEWLNFLGKFYKSKKSVDGGYTYKQAMVDAAKEFKGGNAEPKVGATPMAPAKVSGGNAEKLSALAPSKVSGGKKSKKNNKSKKNSKSKKNRKSKKN
jgi:hypothetical protein